MMRPQNEVKLAPLRYYPPFYITSYYFAVLVLRIGLEIDYDVGVFLNYYGFLLNNIYIVINIVNICLVNINKVI